MMRSKSLAEYLRAGVIPPITWCDSKATVESLLGAPTDWQGKSGPSLSWEGPAVLDYRESHAWHYGSLCVAFDGAGVVDGMSLDFHRFHGPTIFAAPFADLPTTRIAQSDLIEFLRDEHIAFEGSPGFASVDDSMLTEGGVSFWIDPFSDQSEILWMNSEKKKRKPNKALDPTRVSRPAGGNVHKD